MTSMESVIIGEAEHQAAILNALPAHIALLDTDGVITAVNRAWRQFGDANGLYSPGHAVGTNYLSVCDAAQGSDALCAHQAAAGMRSVLDGTVPDFALEYPCHAPTEERWFILTVTPLANAHLNGVVVMHANITERVRIADELYRQRAELRVLFDLVPAMIWFKDTHNRILRVNQKVADAAGLSIAQIEGQLVADIFPQDADRFFEKDLEVIRSQAPKLGIVESVPGPDGAELWVRTDKVPYFDKDGQVAGVVVMAQDITARRQAECDLRDSELRFRQMAESINDVFFLIDAAKNRMLYVSPGYESLTGRSLKSLYANPEAWADTIHPDDRRVALESIQAGIAVGNFEHECRLQRPDGSVGWFRMKGFPVRDDDGTIVRIAGVSTDITESKLAENDLRESETRFRQMAENISDVFFLEEASTLRMLYVSPAYAEIWGRSCASLYADSEGWFESIHSDDRARIQLGYEQGRLDGKLEFDYRIVRPDGSIRWIESRGFPIRDEAGKIVRMTGVAKDVTTRRQAAQDLIASERRFSDMLDNVQLASVMIDRNARITYCNGYLLALTGWTLEEVVGRDWFDTFVPVELGDLRRAFASVLAELPEWWNVECEICSRTRERRLIRWNNSLLRSSAGDVIGVACIGEDITEQKKDELRIKHLNRVYAVLSGINTLIVHVRDRDALFTQACRIAVEEGGFRIALMGVVDPATGKIVTAALTGKDERLVAAIRQILSAGDGTPTDMTAQAIAEKRAIVSNDSQNDPKVAFRSKHAEAGIRSMAILPLIVAGDVVGVLALYASEIDFFHEEEMRLLTGLAGDVAFAIDHIDKGERLSYLAHYDAVTGFANQSLFLERLQEKLLSAQSDPRKNAVFALDIERFKSINDAFGRQAGDELLKLIAERLVLAGGGDVSRFARLGADRFAIVASGMDSVEQIGRYVEQRLDATFRAPFRVGEHDLRVFVKVGIALFPDDGTDADTLLRHAEAALKKAKQGGARYLFFTQKMTERVTERLSLENRLRQALDKDEFVLHYQPKIDLGSRLLTGCEALIRWNDPQTGLVPPMQFIPILEETGLIHEVGRWALRKAIEDYLRWRDAGLAAVRIAVNVSPLQLRNRGFIGEIEQVLGVDPQAAAGLELEITESLIMEDVKHSIASLLAIRAMGVTVAIDDFGTGFSSLNYLSKLPVDTLKIDRSFIIDMTAGPEGLALVSTIIKLSHSMKLKVVAEGVETDEQSRLLRLLSCDEMQGYLFSKPVPGDVFEARFLTPSRA